MSLVSAILSAILVDTEVKSTPHLWDRSKIPKIRHAWHIKIMLFRKKGILVLYVCQKYARLDCFVKNLHTYPPKIISTAYMPEDPKPIISETLS